MQYVLISIPKDSNGFLKFIFNKCLPFAFGAMICLWQQTVCAQERAYIYLDPKGHALSYDQSVEQAAGEGSTALNFSGIGITSGIRIFRG
ncbi:MAG: hypothetical protein GC181_07080 [Bacteroidetes bacterium]|nr:hypothetical protein [Bacteroidota bacterium]